MRLIISNYMYLFPYILYDIANVSIAKQILFGHISWYSELKRNLGKVLLVFWYYIFTVKVH